MPSLFRVAFVLCFTLVAGSAHAGTIRTSSEMRIRMPGGQAMWLKRNVKSFTFRSVPRPGKNPGKGPGQVVTVKLTGGGIQVDSAPARSDEMVVLGPKDYEIGGERVLVVPQFDLDATHILLPRLGVAATLHLGHEAGDHVFLFDDVTGAGDVASRLKLAFGYQREQRRLELRKINGREIEAGPDVSWPGGLVRLVVEDANDF